MAAQVAFNTDATSKSKADYSSSSQVKILRAYPAWPYAIELGRPLQIGMYGKFHDLMFMSSGELNQAKVNRNNSANTIVERYNFYIDKISIQYTVDSSARINQYDIRNSTTFQWYSSTPEYIDKLCKWLKAEENIEYPCHLITGVTDNQFSMNYKDDRNLPGIPFKDTPMCFIQYIEVNDEADFNNDQ